MICTLMRYDRGILAALLPVDCAWILRLLPRALSKVYVTFSVFVARSRRFVQEYFYSTKLFVQIQCQDLSSNLSLVLDDPEVTTQFILDWTSLNLPVRIVESDEICTRIFSLSRDFCYSINKRRLDLLRNVADTEC